jgi:hypothetical protein
MSSNLKFKRKYEISKTIYILEGKKSKKKILVIFFKKSNKKYSTVLHTLIVSSKSLIINL